MLEARGLRKDWGPVPALRGFDLTVRRGEICGLVGHNGAGKSTFARICAGLDRADAGTVTVDGVDQAADPVRARARLGLAPQELALYPTVSLRRNLRFFGALAGLRGPRLRREIAEVAEAMELTGALDRPLGRLSGGQQRRAQAATALLHRPSVLLLDEPTVGADPATRQALLALVRARAEEGAAVCYTTHYLPELDDLGATLAVASAGRIIARGDRADLLARLPARIAIGFHGPPPPALADRAEPDSTAELLLISAVRPAEELARLLADLGPGIGAVRTVEVREPTIDDLYRHLTGDAAGVANPAGAANPANAATSEEKTEMRVESSVHVR